MQIAGGVGFSYLFHVKCDIIRVLVGPTNGWCVNKISSKLLWLLSSLSKGKILNCDYHYWLVREHYIFSWVFLLLFFFIPLPLCLSFLNLLSFCKGFNCNFWQPGAGIPKLTSLLTILRLEWIALLMVSHVTLQNPVKNLGSVISIQLTRNRLAVFLPFTKSAHESFMLAFISQCQLSLIC